MTRPTITTIALPPLPTNCYVLHANGQALVIDPGGLPEPVTVFLRSSALALAGILLTHLHSDHTVGAASLARDFAAPIFASDKDAWMLSDYLGRGDDDWGIPPVEPFTFASLSGGLLPVVGDAWGGCTVLETPGHSPGGLSFYFRNLNALFSGDTLFRSSAGRTDFDGGDRDRLMESLRLLCSLPGGTLVHPGHGRTFPLRESLSYRLFHPPTPAPEPL